jgi:hypothetical protein
MSLFNVRKQLEMLGKTPGMYGITRESLFVHAHVLLCCVGLDSTDVTVKLGRVGKVPGTPDNVIETDMLATPIQIPDDPWAQELSAAALALLPAGSGVYEVTQV